MAGKRSDFNQKGWNFFFERCGHPVIINIFSTNFVVAN